MKSFFIYVFLAIMGLFLLSCSGGSSDSKTEYVTETQTVTDTKTVTQEVPIQFPYNYVFSGNVYDGPCKSGGKVYVYTLDMETLEVSGTPAAQTWLLDNHGSYEIPQNVPRWTQVFIEAFCSSEVTGQWMMSYPKTFSAYIDASNDTRNINPLTTIRDPRLKRLYNTTYAYLGTDYEQRFNLSLQQAESETRTYLNLPETPGYDFSAYNIEINNKAGASLMAGNIKFLLNQVYVGDQMNLLINVMDSLAEDGIGDLSIKEDIRLAEMNADIIQIINNTASLFSQIDSTADVPEFYKYLDKDGDGIRNDDDPDSYIELIVDQHEIKGWSRIADTCNLSFDTVNQRFFANPVIFDSTITASKYFTANFASQYMSIYSVNDHGTADTKDDTPDAPLSVFNGEDYVEKIPYNYLQGPYLDASDDSYIVPQSFAAVITGNTIPVGVNLYVVFWSDSGYRPSGLCQSGEFVQFSRNQYSSDGVNWLGSYPDLNPVYGPYNLLKGAWLD